MAYSRWIVNNFTTNSIECRKIKAYRYSIDDAWCIHTSTIIIKIHTYNAKLIYNISVYRVISRTFIDTGDEKETDKLCEMWYYSRVRLTVYRI